MEQPTSTTTTAGPPDILTPLIDYIKNIEFFAPWWQDITIWFSHFWFGYSIFAYLLALVFLYIFIYASIRYASLKEELDSVITWQREAYESMYGKSVQQNRWNDVLQHLDSANPNDWKFAILEADIMLDSYLKRSGQPGSSLGDRLKGMSEQSLNTLNEAWEAHKVRNQVAHGGADFVLTQKLARDTIARYRAVFTELGLI